MSLVRRGPRVIPGGGLRLYGFRRGAPEIVELLAGRGLTGGTIGDIGCGVGPRQGVQGPEVQCHARSRPCGDGVTHRKGGVVSVRPAGVSSNRRTAVPRKRREIDCCTAVVCWGWLGGHPVA